MKLYAFLLFATVFVGCSEPEPFVIQVPKSKDVEAGKEITDLKEQIAKLNSRIERLELLPQSIDQQRRRLQEFTRSVVYASQDGRDAWEAGIELESFEEIYIKQQNKRHKAKTADQPFPP